MWKKGWTGIYEREKGHVRWNYKHFFISVFKSVMLYCIIHFQRKLGRIFLANNIVGVSCKALSLCKVLTHRACPSWPRTSLLPLFLFSLPLDLWPCCSLFLELSSRKHAWHRPSLPSGLCWAALCQPFCTLSCPCLLSELTVPITLTCRACVRGLVSSLSLCPHQTPQEQGLLQFSSQLFHAQSNDWHSVDP